MTIESERICWIMAIVIALLLGVDLGINKAWAVCPSKNGNDPLVSSLRHVNGETTCTYAASIKDRVTYSIRRTVS